MKGRKVLSAIVKFLCSGLVFSGIQARYFNIGAYRLTKLYRRSKIETRMFIESPICIVSYSRFWPRKRLVFLYARLRSYSTSFVSAQLATLPGKLRWISFDQRKNHERKNSISFPLILKKTRRVLFAVNRLFLKMRNNERTRMAGVVHSKSLFQQREIKPCSHHRVFFTERLVGSFLSPFSTPNFADCGIIPVRALTVSTRGDKNRIQKTGR